MSRPQAPEPANRRRDTLGRFAPELRGEADSFTPPPSPVFGDDTAAATHPDADTPPDPRER